jgi:hypothetical protein
MENTVDTAPAPLRLTAAEYEATVAKIAKLNTRAAKRGWTGTLALTHEVVTETKPNAAGFTVTKTWHEVLVTGRPPCYEGWTFLAEATWTDQGDIVTRCAPGVENVDRDALREGACDHCKTDRRRANVYVVRHTDGRQLQVGRTCLKDFLGWNTSPVWISEDDVTDDISDMFGGGYHRTSDYDTLTVLAAAWACIQRYGFRPASSYDHPTKYQVMDLLDPRTSAQRAWAAEMQPYFDGAHAQAAVIREWVTGTDETGEYMINLRNVARAQMADLRNYGLLASAPQAWARAQERDLIRRAAQADLVNEFAAPVGTRSTRKVQVKSIRYIEGDYGTTTLYILTGDDHRLYKWFASRPVLGNDTDGAWRALTGTVKAHDEYEGTRYTVLTRCKVAA